MISSQSPDQNLCLVTFFVESSVKDLVVALSLTFAFHPSWRLRNNFFCERIFKRSKKIKFDNSKVYQTLKSKYFILYQQKKTNRLWTFALAAQNLSVIINSFRPINFFCDDVIFISRYENYWRRKFLKSCTHTFVRILSDKF